MFIRMYGLPSHDEMDPTIFVALTYTFIFGAMFGDVGQGLCLFIGGGLLYKIKKWNLAGIISVAGIFLHSLDLCLEASLDLKERSLNQCGYRQCMR